MKSLGWARTAALATIAAVSVGGPARAEIVSLTLGAPEIVAGGASFGAAGPYVRLSGTARGELDPADPRNKVIVDLDKAPRNARGRVEYKTDVHVLRPLDAAKSSGVLLYEVTNRGRKLFFSYLADSTASPIAQNTPVEAAHFGNGFGLDRGHTLVWSGWDPDAPRDNGGMAMTSAVATNDGAPIVQRIRHEFQIATRGPGDGSRITLPYAAADTSMAKARLTVRKSSSDAPVEISSWEFIDERTVRLKGGVRFEPVQIYELWYGARDPKVLGIGFAATRDLISYLRHGLAEALGPVGTGPRTKTLALGISQSGRYLRHHLDLGMNTDEKGRRVFDGLLAHISGAGKVFANHRFGMPARTATQHEDRFYPEIWQPFGYAAAKNANSGARTRLLSGGAVDPLVIEVNTSTEYWQKGASLVHTDEAGTQDAKLPAGVRMYLIAGTQHGGRAGLTDAPGLCAMPRNPHSSGPALRALLVALEDWVVRGTAPPPSRIPEIARGTLVSAPAIRMPAFAVMKQPVGANAIGPVVDWVEPPAEVAKPFGVKVPAVDADGNETAGLRLPPIAVPLGTYTGWNLYKAVPSDMCDRDGTFVPFAQSAEQRRQAGDPRRSLVERYGTPEGYVARVRGAAAELVADRLLLQRDADAYVAEAAKVQF